jgi:two-component system, OmpR family, heavy metal sensor histidine kinase CusS
MRLSIRWRLTLWNTLALAVVLVGFAALVYGLLAHALYEQIDRRLLSGFHELDHDERLESNPDGQMRHWAYELYEHERILCAVYDPGGEVRLRTDELAESAVPPAPHPPDDGPRLRDANVPTLGRQRTLEGRIRLGGRDVTLLLLAPLGEIDDELRRLLAALALAVPLALAFCGGLGYLLARAALAPIERLRRAAQEVTAERLDRRLSVANPDDELGRLTKTINEMIGRLERSFAEIRRFTADASHELRTPLAAIRAEAEVALANPSVTPEQERLLGSVLEECIRLARLTDQLLALSREDAGVTRSVHEPVDLSALVGAVAENMRPLAEARELTLHVQGAGNVEVRGDGARLRQVFYNLLDNAIKYTPPGGRVEVIVEAGPVVAVRDTGIGIPPEHLPHVFERFYRVDKARSRGEGGTGLGLSIARSIVVAHGGRIDISSVEGQGTKCTVRLPG